jgi:hypothetical protein
LFFLSYIMLMVLLLENLFLPLIYPEVHPVRLIILNRSIMQSDISRDKSIVGLLQKDYEYVHRVFLFVPLIP